MFCVSEVTAEAIRRAFEESGELAAIAELQRHFAALTDREQARACVRAVIGWSPVVDGS